jgi:16S rRNA (cytosine967-C5)-methyltransferase
MPEAAAKPGPRDVVVDAVTPQAAAFADVHAPALRLQRLEPRDRALAVAIYRTVAQRWITIEHVIDACLRQPIGKLEPELRAILLTAGAQLLFMDRTPAYAVVDEAVGQAHRRLRKGAGKLANAVLRRLAKTELADHLPDPMDTDRFLSVWMSHPVALVCAWRQRFGEEQTRRLLRHSNVNPPTLVHAPDVTDRPRHERAPFIVWAGSHEALRTFLAARPDRWVQDPSAYRAVAMAGQAGLAPDRIVDYCAGAGTKTRQLAHVFPESRITATDEDPGKVESLASLFEGHERVRVAGVGELEPGSADLTLLDVPCSNTGVLARRPEARYRYRAGPLNALVTIQRQILQRAVHLTRPGGAIIYSTCSVEPAENVQQAQYAHRELGVSCVAEHFELPGGEGATYHDGAYAAVLRRGDGPTDQPRRDRSRGRRTFRPPPTRRRLRIRGERDVRWADRQTMRAIASAPADAGQQQLTPRVQMGLVALRKKPGSVAADESRRQPHRPAARRSTAPSGRQATMPAGGRGDRPRACAACSGACRPAWCSATGGRAAPGRCAGPRRCRAGAWRSCDAACAG